MLSSESGWVIGIRHLMMKSSHGQWSLFVQVLILVILYSICLNHPKYLLVRSSFLYLPQIQKKVLPNLGWSYSKQMNEPKQNIFCYTQLELQKLIHSVKPLETNKPVWTFCSNVWSSGEMIGLERHIHNHGESIERNFLERQNPDGEI